MRRHYRGWKRRTAIEENLSGGKSEIKSNCLEFRIYPRETWRSATNSHIYKGQNWQTSFIFGRTRHVRSGIDLSPRQMSIYVSDPSLWKKFYENMSKKYFNPYSYRGKRKHALRKQSFLIPVNRNAIDRDIVQQITPSAAIVERAKGNLKREREAEAPHIDPGIHGKRKRSSDSTKSKKPRIKPARLSTHVSRKTVAGRKRTGKRKTFEDIRSSDSTKSEELRIKPARPSSHVSSKTVAGRKRTGKRKTFEDIWSKV